MYRYASDLELYKFISDSPEFNGLRLRHAGHHNEDLVFDGGRFANVPKRDLVGAIKAWMNDQRVLADDERIYRALRAVGAEKERVYGPLDRLGL